MYDHIPLEKYGILVECPACGISRVSHGEVVLRYCVDDGRYSYNFRCPQCQLMTTGPALTGPVQELVELGKTIQVWRLPAELEEEKPVISLLTPDDLLDFHLLLEGGGWEEELAGYPAEGTNTDSPHNSDP